MLKGALKLLRISALPSALADVLGGSALALAALPWVPHAHFAREKLPWLVLTSVGIYLGGMGLNDLLHRHKDAALNKPRPIVTGAISVEVAALLTSLLYAMGLGASVFAGCAVLALVLALATVAYNALALGKVERGQVRLSAPAALLGVATLAFARGLHVLLPLYALSGGQGAPFGAVSIVFTTVFAYFLLVTLVSLFEDSGGGRRALALVQAALLPVIFAVPLWSLAQGDRGHPLIEDLLPMVIAATLYLWLSYALLRARQEPTPRNLGRCVGLGIRGECLMMAAFALALLPQDPAWGAGAMLCFPAAALLSKWVSPT